MGGKSLQVARWKFWREKTEQRNFNYIPNAEFKRYHISHSSYIIHFLTYSHTYTHTMCEFIQISNHLQRNFCKKISPIRLATLKIMFHSRYWEMRSFLMYLTVERRLMWLAVDEMKQKQIFNYEQTLSSSNNAYHCFSHHIKKDG